LCQSQFLTAAGAHIPGHARLVPAGRLFTAASGGVLRPEPRQQGRAGRLPGGAPFRYFCPRGRAAAGRIPAGSPGTYLQLVARLTPGSRAMEEGLSGRVSWSPASPFLATSIDGIIWGDGTLEDRSGTGP
jgi:hypothetical protein